jgi:hypothetical protein
MCKNITYVNVLHTVVPLQLIWAQIVSVTKLSACTFSFAMIRVTLSLTVCVKILRLYEVARLVRKPDWKHWCALTYNRVTWQLDALIAMDKGIHACDVHGSKMNSR